MVVHIECQQTGKRILKLNINIEFWGGQSQSGLSIEQILKLMDVNLDLNPIRKLLFALFYLNEILIAIAVVTTTLVDF